MTAATEVRAGDLSAALDDPDVGSAAWQVRLGRRPVGVLERRGPAGEPWFTGRIHLDDVDEDLVAEGPTVLSTLRRLKRLAHCRCAATGAASPGWT